MYCNWHHSSCSIHTRIYHQIQMNLAYILYESKRCQKFCLMNLDGKNWGLKNWQLQERALQLEIE